MKLLQNLRLTMTDWIASRGLGELMLLDRRLGHLTLVIFVEPDHTPQFTFQVLA